jgi:small conductance mechanosensitive channel
MLLQISFLSELMTKAQTLAVSFAPKLLGAVLVYIVGAYIIKKIMQALTKVMANKNYDKSLQGFLLSLLRVLFMIMLILTIAGMIGIDITSFAALLAGAGLAIGAALNGSLGNLAGGVMLLIFKPFKVGDLIDAQGTTGTVNEQGIFATTILTPENKTVFLPNGALSTGIITNLTAHGNLRVDITMAIALDQDVEKAKRIALTAVTSNKFVLNSPAPEINVLKVADGMCTLAIRPYALQPHYWDVFFGVQEQVKLAWEQNGINGPTPTRIIISK